MAFLTMRSFRQLVATHGNSFGFLEPFIGRCYLRPVAIGCDRLALSEEGRLVKLSLLVHLAVVAPGRMLISFLALDAHRVGGSCLGFSIP